MDVPVIVTGCRTPIGKYLGVLASTPATDLGAVAVREALSRSKIEPSAVDEVIMGNVLGAGLGQAPARQAALRAGLPPTVSAVTINKVCGSGLQAVMQAAQALRAGDADVIVAGGFESMSRAPFLLTGVREGWKFGTQQAVDSMLHDGLTCAFEGTPMGRLAEATAIAQGVSREDQDRYAAESQRRAADAVASGIFHDEIVPVDVVTRNETLQVDRDEGPRPQTTFESLARLPPAFDAKGTVTAGNASMLSDGAAAVVVARPAAAASLPTPPLARILGYATAGVPPKDLFMAPVAAITSAVARAGLRLDQVDLFELNEAFAAQMVACLRALKLEPDRVNVHGGAIALGHPIGASGARVLVTLLYAMRRRQARYGVASLCLGGGNAVAMVVENLLR